jgi:hypothetical protein
MRLRSVRWDWGVCGVMLLVGASSCRVVLAGPTGLEDALQVCMQEQDDSRRLLCYDREMRNFAHTREKSFGLTAEQQRKSEPPEVHDKASPQILTSIVSAVTARSDGRLMITLANGQMWVQGEAWEVFHVSVGDTVTIKPGILGSLHLYTPSGSVTRVTRAR